MILREATADDLRPLATLYNKVGAQLGRTWKSDLGQLSTLRQQSRIIVLYHDGKLLAALGAHTLPTDRGPGFKVIPFLVDQEHPDRLKFLDAISLYAMNIGLSEGRRVVVSESDRRIPGPVYGRDFLGMDGTQGNAHYILQFGDSRAMIERIFQRRPEWRTSLSSMTAT